MNEILSGDLIPQINKSSENNNEKFLEKELDFWYNKLQNWDIDSDKYEQIKEKINNFILDNQKDKNIIESKYQSLKQELLKETWLELTKEWLLNKSRDNIYDYFWINKITYRNDTIDRFKKWIIDWLIVNNAELVEQIIETNWMIIIDWLKNLLTIDWILELLKSLGNSILDIFRGDSYEKWLNLAELWVIWTWIWAWYKTVKIWVKNFTKNSLKLKNKKSFEESLLKKIDETWKETIDITRLDSDNKAFVNETVTNNFPLVEITRITPNQNIINFSIWWIKWINDMFWQAFCDKIIFELKQTLKDKFDDVVSKDWQFTRVLKDDYKNITFLNPDNEILNKAFSQVNNKSDIIKVVISNLNKEINTYARDLVYQDLKTKNLAYSSKKEFDKLVLKKSNEIKWLIIDNLSFWVWTIKTWEKLTDLEKLNLIRKAEISSKMDINNKKFFHNEYSDELVIDKINKSQDILNFIKMNYYWQKFEFNGVDFDVLSWNKLSAELLRYVKKYPDEVKPQNLVKLVEDYYKNLNASLDFISPVKGDLDNIAFREAHIINWQIRNWLIDKKYFSNTFKWSLSREYFFQATKNIEWRAIFIDIKDMWIDNIFDFQKRAEKILDIEDNINKWLIWVDEWYKKIDKIMLEAGKDVTDKFTKIQQKIQQIYKNSYISLWWDEIYIFLPKKDTNSLLISDIKEIINSNEQNARIIFRDTKKVQDKKEVFEFLDKFSKLNKSLEIQLEKISKEKNTNLVINSNSLSFWENILPQISRPGFNFDKFIEIFETQINNKFKNIISWESIYVDNIFEWINLKIVPHNWNYNIILQ